MGNVLVKEETLTQIAEAIREKAGTDDLYKPGEMPEAILEIEVGGAVAIDDKPIKFYGYAGELVAGYSLKEVAEMTELPPLPAAKGMICQEWNWTLEELKSHGREANVGASFITDDGSTRIYISLVKGALNPILGFAQSVAHSVQVDWGDGSPLETSSVSGSSNYVNMSHQYESAGDYIIRLIPDEGAQIYLGGDAKGTYLLRRVTTTSNANRVYSNAIKKIELGNCIAYVNNQAFASDTITYVSVPNDVGIMKGIFYDCCGLEYACIPRKYEVFSSNMFCKCNCLKLACVPGNLTELSAHCFSNCSVLDNLTLPDSLSKVYSYTFYYCKGLRKLVIPKSLLRIGSTDMNYCESLKEVVMHDGVCAIESSAFSNCSYLKSIYLPEGITVIGNQGFMYCESLQEVILPNSVTSIGMNAFGYCYALSEMVIPEGVTEIGQGAFSNASGIENYYMYPKIPPSLTNKNTFSYISSTCKIHVPKGSLAAYQTAEYWSEYADYMVEMEE